MKPFNLEEAKAGKPVCTRDGRKARILCFDRKCGGYPIIALVETDDDESVFSCTIKGEYVYGTESNTDLMMAPTKQEGWVNVYIKSDKNRACCCIYSTKEEAMRQATMTNGEFVTSYLTTTKIEWEE